jgi:hypothetical protein
MFWEVLWDIFPTHKKIEDPLMWLLLWTLLVETTMISRVGEDENGEDISSL